MLERVGAGDFDVTGVPGREEGRPTLPLIALRVGVRALAGV